MNKERLFRNLFAIIRVVSYLLITYMIYSLIVGNTRLMCIWNEKYGIICPSCGATRATLLILKGDIITAINYNLVYTVAVFPGVCIFIFEDILMILLRVFRLTSKSTLLETFFDIEEVMGD